MTPRRTQDRRAADTYSTEQVVGGSIKILRVSTLLLSLLIAVFALSYANPAFAGKPDCDDEEHPSCKPPDDGEPPAGGIKYTATLTGAFAFVDVVVFPDSKNLQLKSPYDITITRPGGADIRAEDICATDDDTDLLCMLWNSVFEECPNFFGPTMVNVPEFEASADRKGWTIEKPGGIGVVFRAIPFTVPVNGDVQVSLILTGDTPYQEPFLPVVPTEDDNPTTIRHELKSFWIHGKSGRGAPDKHCKDGSEEGIGELTTWSVLTITASLPPPP